MCSSSVKFKLIKIRGFWGRLLGRCSELKDSFESCSQREFDIKRKQNLADAKATHERWKKKNAELVMFLIKPQGN